MIDSLDGILTRVLFHAPSKWNAAGVPFLIGKLTNGSIVKGELRKPMMGERYRFWGEWKAQKGRDEPAFEFTSHEVLVDQSVAGMVDYLMTYVDGLGIVKATALVETFGLDTLKTLRTQPEAALAIHGISETIMESIREHFQENAEFDPVAYAKLIDLFSNHRVPKKVVKALLKDFGSDAPNVVMESPYKLLAYPRMGWKTVDAFAMTTAGYDRAGIERHKCAIVEALERLSNQGHTYGRRSDIERIAFELVDDRPRSDAWVAAEQEGLIVEVFGDSPGETSGTSGGASNTSVGAGSTGELLGYALPKLAEAEAEIARRLAVLAATAEPLPFPLLDAVSEDDQRRDKHLNDDQIEAVRLVGENGVVILAGSPGTGKTLTITRVVSTLIGNGISSIRICTPTGKAAKRAAELLDQAGISTDIVPCTTIHRALGPRPSDAEEGASAAQAKVGRGREGFSFGRNEDNPLEVRFLVIDECFPSGTMIDTPVGPCDISQVHPGQEILNAVGVDRVVAVAKREVHRVVRIEAEGQEAIYCSGGHPFFTRRGLVIADELRPGEAIVKTVEAMRLLRHSHQQAVSQTPTVLQLCLQRAMVDAVPGVQQQGQRPGIQAEGGGRPQCVLAIGNGRSRGTNRADSSTQAYRASRDQGKNLASIAGDRPRSLGSRRQRASFDGAATALAEGAWRGLDARVGHCSRGTNTGIPDQLQSRSGTRRSHDRNRDRRQLPSQSESLGHQERCNASFARVDRVEVLEQGDPRLDQFRDADGKLYFYDLQATRHQSFSVHGLLVHNCSMVDVSLGASLLRAVAPGTRVVFVGDPNQLPSVGPGSVLRDMIAAGVPTAMLTQIQRSAGRIVRACHAIKDGVEPRPSGEADIEGGENWIHLESDEPKEIVETIVNLHATVKTMDPLWDMQVVTPQKTRLPFACDNLNRRLSALLNHLAAQEDAANGKAGEVSGEVPRDVQAEGEEGYGPPFRVGDKVVRTKNGIADELMVPGPTNGFITDEEDFRVDWNWDGKPWRLTETDVVNGDMGTVLDIVPGDKDAFVVVKFRLPDRLCRLPYGDCHLIPAYAMTAHKCQGSGFPYVIVPVHHSFYWDQKTQTGLFNRELLYTAISRSEKLLVTVGQASAIRAAIGRKTLHQRNTRLRELLHHFHPIEATSSEA